MKKFVKATLFAISLSMLVPLSQVASAADDTYERICLTLGWTSCGEWTIYDANGVEKNRVVGPISDTSTVTTQSDTSTVTTQSDTSTVTTRPNSALIALCGVNMCGGGLGGYAVLTRTYSPPTAAELATKNVGIFTVLVFTINPCFDVSRMWRMAQRQCLLFLPSRPGFESYDR